MERQEMLDIIAAWGEIALVNADPDGGDKYWKPDMIFHGPTGMGELHGTEEYKDKLLRPWHAAFTGYSDTTEVTVVDEQEQLVVMHGVATSTHTGPFMGIPATGRTIQARYMDIWRFEDGLMAENWVAFDMAGLLEQLGGLGELDELPATLAG